jgi:hypothetical protein
LNDAVLCFVRWLVVSLSFFHFTVNIAKKDHHTTPEAAA